MLLPKQIRKLLTDLIVQHPSGASEADPTGAFSLPAGPLAVEDVAIDRLRPDPANPRRIGNAELDALERSLRSFGFVQPVLARRETAQVIGGHQRLVAARRLGLRTVPVIWLDLDEDQARLLGLALNKISGEWDEALLARLLADLQAAELDVSLTGFGEDEVTELLRSLETREKRDRPESFDLDRALEEAAHQQRTKLGDLWRLGPHLVACGDSTLAGNVERPLAGRRAAMAFVDPPYNVRLGEHGGRQVDARARRLIANDDLGPAAWEAFVRAWTAILLGAVDGALYVCMSSKELPLLSRVLAEAGGHWSDTIIWSKDRPTLGRADLQRAYEPIWYGWREGTTHHWCGDRDQTDVWSIARPSASPLHPVMKPIELVERAITNSSQPNDLVLDVFLGAGSTVIAAERTGRTCAGVELDPVYVDVTIKRWERFTGKTAQRLDGPDSPPAPAEVLR